MDTGIVRVQHESLRIFCQTVFQKLNLSEEDARISADVLVMADLRGLPSHGVNRLQRYVNGVRYGFVIPNAPIENITETPSSIVINANGGMGAPVSVKTMRRVIEKAKSMGAGFGCVQNSNHFGIAGYYAMMALERDMIGIAMTNTAPLGVPTFGRKPMFGTNPIAFAAPADKERAFVLDMSTTVVTRGKIEVCERLGKEIPKGWAVDKTGYHARDAHSLIEDMVHQVGGGILPLGGLGEELGGHKGYGLAVMVDILCSVLSGAPFGADLYDTDTTSGHVSHFFGAIKINLFRDPQGFRHDMDRMLNHLRNCQPAEGEERVWFAGLKEFECEEKGMREGIELFRETYDELCTIGERFGVKAPREIAE